MSDNLPNYRGCLNLLQAHYALWWRDAQRDPQQMQQLADWTDQPVDLIRRARPGAFRSFPPVHHRPSPSIRRREPLLSAQENP